MSDWRWRAACSNTGNRILVTLGQLRATDGFDEYRGRTTLVVATDHGRGSGKNWITPGKKTPEAKYVWMMYMGPDTPPLVARSQCASVTQSQIATTIAALLGQHYKAAVPQSGAPLVQVMTSNK